MKEKIIKQSNVKAVSNRRFQVGVMGSAADLNYSEDMEKIAEKIGELLAKNNCTVIYGAEKDYDSLSTAAARGAKMAGGITVGVTYGKGKDIWDKENNTDVLICSGLERGGGRETTLVLSCDAIITISGGSGTLTEMAIAYQANIPIVAMAKTGGWSEKMAGQYFDNRKRLTVCPANSPEEAVQLVIDKLLNN